MRPNLRPRIISIHPHTRLRLPGFTLIEVVIALSLLTVGFLGFASFFVVNARSYDNIREEALVLHALRQTAERIRGAPFARIASTYQGYAFAIDEIHATGQVRLFLNETDGSAAAMALGLPRDLNGDGLANSPDVSASYLLCPLRIEVAWSNPRGPQVRTLDLLFAQEAN
jgi:prepilin-type N-terminal cleavage/methylation domain-containing protein